MHYIQIMLDAETWIYTQRMNSMHRNVLETQAAVTGS